jgi:hypothetical protein
MQYCIHEIIRVDLLANTSPVTSSAVNPNMFDPATKKKKTTIVHSSIQGSLFK